MDNINLLTGTTNSDLDDAKLFSGIQDWNLILAATKENASFPDTTS